MEVVACAVTFGTVIAQLGAVTIKFKLLWDEVAGVPDRISELLEEMEFFRLLFAQMETSIEDPNYPNLPMAFWTGPLMQISFDRAKRALTALEGVMKELDDELKTQRKGLKRTIIAIRGLMNKDKIQGLVKRFEKAMRLLQMSYDLCSRNLQEERLRRHVTHTIRAEMTVPITALHSPSLQSRPTANTDGSHDMNERRISSRKIPKAQSRAIFRCRLPSWWSTTVWELCSAPQPGWNYGLRIYNMVPDDSPIMRSIDSGDAQTVTTLFRLREASPFDRDENNLSLLQRAVSQPRPSLSTTEALVEWTPAEVISERTAGKKSPLEIVSVLSIRRPDIHIASRQILQLFWPLNHDVDEFWHVYDPDSRFLDEGLPAYHMTSTRYKIEAVRRAVTSGVSSLYVNTRWISTDGTVQPVHVALSLDCHFSLMHSAAVRLAAGVSNASPGDYDELLDDMFTQAIIKASTPNDLHHLEAVMSLSLLPVDLPPVTSLMCLISSIPAALVAFSQDNEPFHIVGRFTSPDALHRIMRRALQIWVHNLRCAGVDLAAYGCKERSLLHDDDGFIRGVCDADSEVSTIWWEDRDDDFMEPLPIWLIDLTYGAEPEEWDLIFVIEFEAMARDFWDLIEEQQFMGMPGSWVE